MSPAAASIVSLANRLLYQVHARRQGVSAWNENTYSAKAVPDRIDVGLTDLCNEKCFMCPNPALGKPRGFMEEQLFYKLVDEAHAAGVRTIGLGLFGEPTLHKQFTQFTRYVNERGLRFCCSTNAVALRKDITDCLVDQGDGRLHVSLYASSPEAFEKVHGINGKIYHAVVRNIEYLLERRAKSGGDSKLLIYMNYLDTGKDDGGYQAWLDKWMPLLKTVPHVESTEKAYITWMGRVEKRAADGPKAGVMHYNRPCARIVGRLAVDWDGRVTACCYSWDEPSLDLGNIGRESLMDIWNGPGLRSLRAKMLRCDVSALPGCAKCEESVSEMDPIGFLKRSLRLAGR